MKVYVIRDERPDGDTIAVSPDRNEAVETARIYDWHLTPAERKHAEYTIAQYDIPAIYIHDDITLAEAFRDYCVEEDPWVDGDDITAEIINH